MINLEKPKTVLVIFQDIDVDARIFRILTTILSM